MLLTKKKGLYESSRIVYLPVGEVSPNPDQPRRTFEPNAMRELSESVARYGVLQPLTVRRRGDGFELVSGERRLRAAKLAGLREVPCIILDVDSQESSVLALVENLQRRDLDFIEEAQGLQRLVTIYGYSQEEIARLIGRSQPAVANKLRILRLPQEVLYTIREARLTERHARALLRVHEASDMERLLEKIIRDNLNVAAAEELIEVYLAYEGRAPEPKPPETHRRAPVYVLKDVRLFLNTLSHSLSLMRQSGISAQERRDETEEEIILTIKIPKNGRSAVDKPR